APADQGRLDLAGMDGAGGDVERGEAARTGGVHRQVRPAGLEPSSHEAGGAVRLGKRSAIFLNARIARMGLLDDAGGELLELVSGQVGKLRRLVERRGQRLDAGRIGEVGDERAAASMTDKDSHALPGERLRIDAAMAQ